MKSGKGLFPILLALSLMWGSAYIFMKVSSVEIPPMLLAAFRSSVALPILAGVCIYRRELSINRKTIRDILVVGTLNGWLPNCLATLAISRVSSAEAGIIQSTTPIITGVTAAPLLKGERLSAITVASLVTGFLGVVLVISSASDPAQMGDISGYLLMLCVSACFGIGTVYARWARPSPPALIASGQLVVATLAALALSWGFGEKWSAGWSALTVISVACLGIFSSALPSIIFLIIIAKYQAVKVGAASFLQPIWAILLGVLFLGESIQVMQLAGTVVIIVSVIMITMDLNVSALIQSLRSPTKIVHKDP